MDQQLLGILSEMQATMKGLQEQVTRMSERSGRNNITKVGKKTKKKKTFQPPWTKIMKFFDGCDELDRRWSNKLLTLKLPNRKAMTEEQKSYKWLYGQNSGYYRSWLGRMFFRLKFLTGFRVPTAISLSLSDVKFVPYLNEMGRMVQDLDAPGMSRYFAGVLVRLRRLKTGDKITTFYGASKCYGGQTKYLDIVDVLYQLCSSKMAMINGKGGNSAFLFEDMLSDSKTPEAIFSAAQEPVRKMEKHYRNLQNHLGEEWAGHFKDPSLLNFKDPSLLKNLTPHDSRSAFRVYAEASGIPLEQVLQAANWTTGHREDTAVSARYDRAGSEVVDDKLRRLMEERRRAKAESLHADRNLVATFRLHFHHFNTNVMEQSEYKAYGIINAQKIVKALKNSSSKGLNPSHFKDRECYFEHRLAFGNAVEDLWYANNRNETDDPAEESDEDPE